MSSLCLVIYQGYASLLTGETDDKVRWFISFDNWSPPSAHVAKESPAHRWPDPTFHRGNEDSAEVAEGMAI